MPYRYPCFDQFQHRATNPGPRESREILEGTSREAVISGKLRMVVTLIRKGDSRASESRKPASYPSSRAAALDRRGFKLRPELEALRWYCVALRFFFRMVVTCLFFPAFSVQVRSPRVTGAKCLTICGTDRFLGLELPMNPIRHLVFTGRCVSPHRCFLRPEKES